MWHKTVKINTEKGGYKWLQLEQAAPSPHMHRSTVKAQLKAHRKFPELVVQAAK